MAGSEQYRRRLGGVNGCAKIAAYALALPIILFAAQLHAQTFTVLHSFGGPGDGGFPLSGVSIDAHGNIYGATPGTVYKLRRGGSGWIYSKLYTHGAFIESRPLIGKDGSLYLSDSEGGPQNAGMVFNLRPPTAFCSAFNCPWEATALFKFDGGADGNFPTTLTFDSAGNIYGTTVEGGAGGGTVFKLTNDQGSWTYTQITDFFGSGTGIPGNGGAVDQNGNLFGTSIDYPGQIFEVTNSGEVKILFHFNSCDTYAGVIETIRVICTAQTCAAMAPARLTSCHPPMAAGKLRRFRASAAADNHRELSAPPTC